MENTTIDFSSYPNTIMLKGSISRQLEKGRKLDAGRLDHLSTIATNYLAKHPQKGKLIYNLLVSEGVRHALTQLEAKAQEI